MKLSRLGVGMALVMAMAAGTFAARDAAKGPKVGDAAPDFTLPVVNRAGGGGGDWSLAKDGKDKIVVVNFDSIQCPVMRDYRERLNALAKKYEGKATFVSINANEPEPAADVGKKLAEAPYPVLKDAGAKVADAYGALTTPHVFIIDTAGKLRYIGAIDNDQKQANPLRENYVANALDALLAGKDVTVSTSKPFGCSIKRPK